MGNLSILTIVVIGLVLALLVELVGCIVLALNSVNIPGELWTLAVAEVTGLLGLLAPSKDAVQPAGN